MKNTTPSTTRALNTTAEDQIQRIAENLTQAIDGHKLAEESYVDFESVIDRIERKCKKVAFKSIIDRANVTNADAIKADVDELYTKHIKNYPAQLKQAILDRQETLPIARNAAIAVRALCHQMLSLARAKVKAAKAAEHWKCCIWLGRRQSNEE